MWLVTQAIYSPCGTLIQGTNRPVTPDEASERSRLALDDSAKVEAMDVTDEVGELFDEIKTNADLMRVKLIGSKKYALPTRVQFDIVL